MPLVTGSDGLPARTVHRWSDEKLYYVERYMEIFTTGMKNRWPLIVYADLFSGPGLNVEPTGRESLGSPLRALRLGGFSRVFANDADPEAVRALRERTKGEHEDRLAITQADCNEAVRDARAFLFPAQSRSSTLGLAFIDPTAFQMRFDAMRELTSGVNLDLIITFMTSYPRRFLGRDAFGVGSDFDLFMGTRGWRALVGLNRNRRTFTRQLLDIYERQLGSLGYTYVDDDVRILNRNKSTVYHLVFASRHPRGKEFFARISQRSPGGDRRLL